MKKGEYFVVTRGKELGNFSEFATVLFGSNPTATDTKPKYDRSYEGDVFEASEICGNVIAAKYVHCSRFHYVQCLGRTISLHTNEIEICPVTKEYVNALTGQ